MGSALSNTLEEAANAIKKASNHLSADEVNKCLDLIDVCFERQSKVIISGVGKSGIVARKMAATFSSIGIMAVYINPLDALHGDIGVLHSLDICIFLSNSGETTEILDMIYHVKKRGVKIVSIVGNVNSSIAKESDSVLAAKVDQEICPLNLAPTASTTVALAIGDAIAIEWMKMKKLSVEDFAINHPAGSLGKKVSLRVSELMIPLDEINTLSSQDNIQTVISVMTSNGIGTCLIMDNQDKQKLSGIITDGDLRRGLENNKPHEWDKLYAKDFMNPNPITIRDDLLATNALILMESDKNKPITILAVVDKADKLIGMLRMHEIVKAGLKEI